MACEFNIQTLATATDGEIISQVSKSFIGVETDTRRKATGQIFFALKGENFDAHEFLPQAVAQGAKVLIVHELPINMDELKTQVSILKVKDTLRALQDLAKYWRRQIPAKIFAVTGSNGKTTTKEFAATILSEQFKVHYSKGSFNNHWGVPLTLLGVSKFHEVCVLEMGMNHEGELTQLCKIAEPDVVLCTTVGRSHIGNFAGSQQRIADAKEEIYLASPKAKKIFNYDNEYTLKMFERVSKLQGTENIFVFSAFTAGAEVSFRAHSMNFEGLEIKGHIAGIKGEAKISVFGRHNVTNLMAASSLALAMNMEPERIWAALPKCRTEWGRTQLYKLPNGTNVLFDAYNANPDSMAALVKNCFEIYVEGGKKVAVLGEMRELGSETALLHEELGEMIGNTDFEVIWFMGPSGPSFEAGMKKAEFSKTLIISNDYDESLAKKVLSMLNPSDTVVMKGSRGMKLERVLKCWDPQFATY